MNVEIITDRRTVWVNEGTLGLCIGRFSPFGIDIHTGPQQDGVTQRCLDCTHSQPTLSDWDRFVQGMKAHHGVKVLEKYKPDWVENTCRTPPRSS